MGTAGSENRARRSSEPADPDVEVLLQRIETTSDADERSHLRDEAVVASLPMADSLAHRYVGRGVEEDDLVQVARLALVKAVRRYHSNEGHGFAAFAVPTIRGEIKKHFRDLAWTIRPPRHLQELSQQVLVEDELLGHELGRRPHEDEVAASLGIDDAELRDARVAATGFRVRSLDAPLGRGQAEPAAADEFDAVVVRDELRAVLAGLTPRELMIVHLRFVDDCTQSEIGQAVGVSQMQVSRLLSSILERLRAALTATRAA